MRTSLLSGLKGRRNEQRVEGWLRRQGLDTLARNYRCRQGEIDLVMRDPDGTVVFVEVRYRGRDSHGGALASVDARKQQRLINAARHYLAAHPAAAYVSSRFDVVAVGPDTTARGRIEWITNAFFAE